MRVLLDTNILVRAAAGGSGPARAVLLLSVSRHTLVSAEFILDEVRRALSYPRLKDRLGLSDEQIQAYVAELSAVSILRYAISLSVGTQMMSLSFERLWPAG